MGTFLSLLPRSVIALTLTTCASVGFAQCPGSWLSSSGGAASYGLGPFRTAPAATIFDIATMTNGSVVMAGAFSEIGTIFANNIAKWDGQTWSALGEGLTSPASIATGPNNTLFATDSGAVVKQWNGTAWTTVGGNFPSGSSVARVVVLPDGTLVAAGNFAAAPGNVSAANVARWNGTTWAPLGAGLAGPVDLTVLPNGDLVALHGAQSSQMVSRWNGTTWTNLNLPSGVYPLGPISSLPNGNFLLAAYGGFYQTQVYEYGAGVWVALGNPTFVFATAIRGLPNGRVVLGGNATIIDGQAQATESFRIAEWTGSQWEDRAFRSFEPNRREGWAVRDFEPLANNSVAVAGKFGALGGVPTDAIALLSGNTFSPWQSQGLNLTATARTLLSLPNGSTHISGNFTSAGNLVAGGAAIWDGSQMTVAGSTAVAGAALSGAVLAPNGDVIEFGTASSGNVWRLTGSSRVHLGFPLTFGPTGSAVRATVHDAAFRDGELYIVGDFSMSFTPGFQGIAKYDGANFIPVGGGMSFGNAGNPSDGGTGYSIVRMPNNDLVVAGQFAFAGSTPCVNIARWDGTTWSALGAGLVGGVADLELLPSGDLLALTFGNGIYRWNGSQWSTLLESNPNRIARMKAQPNGDIVVVGAFTQIDGVPASSVARLRAGASTWEPVFSERFGRTVYDIVLNAEGDALVVGDFRRVGDVFSVGFARFDVPSSCCDSIDFNNNALFPEDADLVDLLNILAGGTCSAGNTCNDIDFNNDGLFPDDNDLIAFLRVLAGGPC